MATVEEPAADIENFSEEANAEGPLLTDEKLAAYFACSGGTQEAADFLSVLLRLPSYRFDAREAIQLDYASYLLDFAKEQKLGPLRTASLFDVGQKVIKACMEGQQSTDCQALLKKELLQKCKAKVAVDSSDFTADLVSKAGQFFARTLFAHFRLYSYSFTMDQDLTEFSSTLLVETPLIPASFESAITSDEWEAKLEKARLDGEAARKAEEEEQAARAEAEMKQQEERAFAEAKALREEELRKKPETLDAAVAQAVALRLDEEKAKLAAEYREREETLVRQIQDLETKVGGGAKKK